MELVNYFPCQNCCKFGHSKLEILIKLIVIELREIANIDKTSNFQFTKVLIDEPLIIYRLLLNILLI